MTAPNYQILGQPLTLQCEVTTVRGIKSPTYVIIVWSSNDIELERMPNASVSYIDRSLVHRDRYTTPILSTIDNGRVIQCEVEINSSPPVMASGNITLNLTGKYVQHFDRLQLGYIDYTHTQHSYWLHGLVFT